MLRYIFPERKRLDDYGEVMTDQAYSEVLALARPLLGKRILHINATPTGGGVAELLRTLVPLTNSVGIMCDWGVIKGSPEFFNVSKTMHNSLQGNPMKWTQEMWDIWFQYNEANANEMDPSGYDYIVVHDPQPAAILTFLKRKNPAPNGRWIWRCHIDLTDAQEQVWDTVRPCIELYDAVIFTLQDFMRRGIKGPRFRLAPPGIDPLSPKNLLPDPKQIERVLAAGSIDPNRPIISQISRLDPWKDPLGVIDAYRLVKTHQPDVQLVLVSSMAPDDPEGWVYYEKALRHAGEDADIHFLTDRFSEGNDDIVSAIQAASDVVLQKSIREGFGLTAAEALWKGKPVVAGDAGGLRLQIVDGVNGFLVDDVQTCADRVLYLLENPGEGKRMGDAGREHVRKNFLITRYLRDYLSLLNAFENGN